MDASTASLSVAIGVRIREERKAQGWTLNQLAGASGVSRRMLVNVEQGIANPSVGTLLRISDALGLGLPALVEPPDRKPLKVTRNGEGATLWTSRSDGRGVLVAGTAPPQVVELWDWTLGPGDEHESDAHAPGTKELLQIREGAMTVVAGEQSIALETGDAAAFPGDLAHSYANPHPEPARFSLVVFEPSIASDPRRERNDA